MHSWLKRGLLATACIGALIATACTKRQSQIVSAPNFELKDITGKIVSLEGLKGKTVLLDFWATWCGPCRMSIPMVQEFYMRHKDDNLVVLGVNIDDDPSNVYSFVKRMKMTYPVVFAGNTSVTSDYEVDGIPMFVFVDPLGRIVRRYQGFAPEVLEAWEEDFKQINKHVS